MTVCEGNERCLKKQACHSLYVAKCQEWVYQDNLLGILKSRVIKNTCKMYLHLKKIAEGGAK